MTEYKEYAVEDGTGINVVDGEGMINLACTLSYRARVAVASAGGAESAPLTEDGLRSLTAASLNAAYCREYEGGMPVEVLRSGRPDAALTEAAAERLKEALSARYGVSLASLDVEEHRISEADRQSLDELLHFKELADPKRAAEELVRAMQAGAQPKADRAELPPWTCSCGSVNKSRFCPECGKPSGRWLCACGKLNTTPFCPECGSPAGSGTRV